MKRLDELTDDYFKDELGFSELLKLIEEGITREIVNRIQNIRKNQGLDVTDKIEVNLKKTPKLEQALKK